MVPKKEASTPLAQNNFIDIWAHQVVKAWAKLNGCYYNIIHGKVEEFLTDLSGYNYEKVSLQTEGIFDVMQQEYNLGFIIQAVPTEASVNDYFKFESSQIYCSIV